MPRRLLLITLAAAAVLAGAAPWRQSPRHRHIARTSSDRPSTAASPAIRWLCRAAMAAGCTWVPRSRNSSPRTDSSLSDSTFGRTRELHEPYEQRSISRRTGRLSDADCVRAHGTSRKPILIGVSEGAGLRCSPRPIRKTKPYIAGVIGLGLPDLNELGGAERRGDLRDARAAERAAIQRRGHRVTSRPGAACRDSFDA